MLRAQQRREHASHACELAHCELRAIAAPDFVTDTLLPAFEGAALVLVACGGFTSYLHTLWTRRLRRERETARQHKTLGMPSRTAVLGNDWQAAGHLHDLA